MLSSAWESEQRQHAMIDWSNPKNNWMRPEIRSEIAAFQDTYVEQEFSRAVEQHQVEEVYWVGGEPLMYEQHWRYMRRIIELGDGQNVYARYNTNLSRVVYRGVDLYEDVLDHLRDWQICASLDGTGAIGEYIRTGLDFEDWCANFQRGMDRQQHPRQMRIDFTLTLPGLFEIGRMQKLADEFGTDILAKVIFSFTPDIVMSPLALPRKLLDRIIDQSLENLPAGAMRDVLWQLKKRPTFQEQWPETWQDGLAKGKARVLKLEKIRNDKFTMGDILSQDKETYGWWQSIT